MSPTLAAALAWGGPAALALGLAVSLWFARAQLGLWPTGRRGWAAVLVGLAAATWVRLVFVPAWWAHRYDGHEAEYYAIFRGDHGLQTPSTRLYPAMQALWWAAGHLLPRVEQAPVLVSLGLSLLGGLCLARAGERLLGRVAGLSVAVLWIVYPAAAAWATSAYNVAAPHALLALSLAAAAAVLVGLEERPTERTRAAGWASGLAFGLAVACRLEVAVFGVTLFGLALAVRGGVRDLLAPLVVGALLGAASAGPLLAEGTPGSGEREVALQMNLLWFDPYGAWGSGAGLVLMAVAAGLCCVHAPRRGVPLALGVVVIHAGMACFDDFGERHALLALPGLLLLLGGAAQSWRGRGLAVTALALAFLAPDLVSLRGRYEGSEQSFAALLRRPPYASLPVRALRRPPAAGRSPLDDSCAWISEDGRVASEPFLSHFNLWDPAEVQELAAPGGCLHWCLDASDWRWDSRSVRDRALRVAHLYEITPIAVVEDSSSGYACLVMELGSRRCCGPGQAPFALRPSGLAAIP